MRAAIIRLNAETLRELLGLPADAVVIAVQCDPATHGLGEVRVLVHGLGPEVAPGAVVPQITGTVTVRTLEGKRFYAVDWGAASKPLDNPR